MTVRSLLARARSSTIWTLATMAASYTDAAAPTQTYGVEVIFRTDGTLDILKDVLSDLLNEVSPYVDPTARTANTWVRCHFISGDTMTAGDTLETWLQLNAQKAFVMRYASSGGSDFITGDFDFELSSDSSGSPIVAQALAVTIKAGELF